MDGRTDGGWQTDGRNLDPLVSLHLGGLDQKLPTYLPYYSVARYTNTIFFWPNAKG